MYGPALSHVHDVVMLPRAAGVLPHISTKATRAATNDPMVVKVEM